MDLKQLSDKELWRKQYENHCAIGKAEAELDIDTLAILDCEERELQDEENRRIRESANN